MFETDLQKTVYYNSYSRWDSVLNRREHWPETVSRVMRWLNKELLNHLHQHSLPFPAALDMPALESAMLNLEVLPSMRIVQMAGPALDRCHVGSFNCSYLPLQDWRSFSELLYILMQGTGCGFSVEQQVVNQLPVIERQSSKTITRLHVIDDSTEGWCDALLFGLTTWAAGDDVQFDYSNIRPQGAPLKTKGGTASGPEPLRQLLEFSRKLLLNHQGRKLSSLNCHDLACFCGSIVQVGGVRRAAEISLSDPDDEKMRKAKQGQFWLTAPERAMANNSAVYTSKPSMNDFIGEWTELMSSGTGERGIFNRGDVWTTLPIRRADRNNPDTAFGLNPCGEIILRPFEFCNLSVAVVRPKDLAVDLERKVALATQFGMLQSLLTRFNYIRPEWKANCEEERLLGVDITGQMDNGLFNSGIEPEYTEHIYLKLRTKAYETAQTLSSQLGISMPAAITCVKPSGNSSQLLNVSSGIHPRYAPYYIRRLRMGADSPVAKLLIDAGVPHFSEVGQPANNPAIWVFEFPVKSPTGATVRSSLSALDQLEQWLLCKQYYTEHNPSCTIQVKEDEWLEVGAWVYRHWAAIGGLSFLPYSTGVYQLAPYEECSQAEYEKRVHSWPHIDFTKLPQFEATDHTEVNRDYACLGGQCEL